MIILGIDLDVSGVYIWLKIAAQLVLLNLIKDGMMVGF